MKKTNKTSGFTLVELAVVVVIIGVLAAFGVPQFRNAVERSKASEAFAYLSSVREAQERYLAKEGAYASDQSLLDINQQTPKYFSVGTLTATETAWSQTLTRLTGAAGYSYTVAYDQDGYDTNDSDSTIEKTTNLPINPMGHK